MNKPIATTLPPLSLGREEASEILDIVGQVISAMGGLPYRDARPAIVQLDAIREHIEFAFPGGMMERCLFCSQLLGIEEAVTDENGEAACRECAEAEFETQAIELAQRQARGEWIDWVGGDCPVPPETVVQVRYVDGPDQRECAASAYRWDWRNDGTWGDIVAYRVPLPTLAPVSFVNSREPGEFGEGATVAAKPKSEPLVNWNSAAETAQAVIDGYLPPGYRTEGLTLIVPDLPVVPRMRGHSTTFAMFDEVRTEGGVVLKSKHGGGHE